MDSQLYRHGSRTPKDNVTHIILGGWLFSLYLCASVVQSLGRSVCRFMTLRFLFSVFSVLSAVNLALAQSKDPTYWQDIRPVFRKHCTVCHSTRYLKKPDVSGGLALDTFDVALKGTTHAVVR